MLQTSVEIVNPGGTGSPAFVISAKPEPLPPSKSFMLRLPSALPLPKKYTCFFDFGGFPACPARPAFPAFFFAIQRLRKLFWRDLRDVTDLVDNHTSQTRHQRQPRAPKRWLLGHDQNVGKETIDRRIDRAQLLHRLDIVTALYRTIDGRQASAKVVHQRQFGGFFEHRSDIGEALSRVIDVLRDVLDSLEQ